MILPRSGRARILLIDESEAESHLLRSALEEGGFSADVRRVSTGPAALDYLKSQSASGTPPHLVLLDLNLPGMTGHEILSAIRRDREFGRIPVIVLTTSDDPRDIQASYDRQANCYVTKPVDVEDFFDSVRAIAEFWLGIARLPGAD